MQETYGQKFTVKWIRYNFKEEYGDTLVIYQKRGVDDVNILSQKASSLLYDFRQKQCSDVVSKERGTQDN